MLQKYRLFYPLVHGSSLREIINIHGPSPVLHLNSQRVLNDHRGPGFLAVVRFGSFPLFRQQVVFLLSQSSCVSPVDLLTGEGGGWARSRIIRPQESVVLYKSFNISFHILQKSFDELCAVCMIQNRDRIPLLFSEFSGHKTRVFSDSSSSMIPSFFPSIK